MGIPFPILQRIINARTFAWYCAHERVYPSGLLDAVILSFANANAPIEPETYEEMIAPLVAAGFEVSG